MNNLTYQLPTSFSLQKSIGLIGNSIQVSCARYFLEKTLLPKLLISNSPKIKFFDCFAGIGGFHIALEGYGECVLASDNNPDCQTVYQSNFPDTPFLLGDINSSKIQERILTTDFNLLCAGFPCQSYSKANTSKNKKDTVIGSLLLIVEKKRPNYFFFENVPQLIKYPIWIEITEKLKKWGYILYVEKLNPLDLGIPQNRPRIFIWGEIESKEENE